MLIAATAVVGFTSLGFWQLRRLDERRQLNATIEATLDMQAVDLNVALGGGDDPEQLAWQRVVADGTYDSAAQVILAGRSLDGASGRNVLTPLLLGEGTAIVVNRGWIPLDGPLPDAEPGPVSVTGVLRNDEGSGVLGGGSGIVIEIGSIDLRRLDAQVDADVLPVYLHLESQIPSRAGAPLPVPLPELGQGSHLSYAVQWFLFAAIVVIGFPTLLVRTAKGRVSRTSTPSTPSSSP